MRVCLPQPPEPRPTDTDWRALNKQQAARQVFNITQPAPINQRPHLRLVAP